VFLFLLFIITLFFVKEGFGIKVEILMWCLGTIPLIISSVFTSFSFYDVAEGYFPTSNIYGFGLLIFNFVVIIIPIIKTFIWSLSKKKELGNLKPFFLAYEEKNQLIEELVNGKDPNSNYKYILCVIEDEKGINFLKEYAKTEFSIENVNFNSLKRSCLRSYT
jgi:hypothetical protein